MDQATHPHDVSLGEVLDRADAALAAELDCAADALQHWLDTDGEVLATTPPELTALDESARDIGAAVDDALTQALAPVEPLMEWRWLTLCSPTPTAGGLPLPPSHERLSEIPAAAVIEIYTAVGEALRSPDRLNADPAHSDPVNNLRRILDRVPTCPAELVLLDWVCALANAIVINLDFLPQRLRRLELAGMARLVIQRLFATEARGSALAIAAARASMHPRATSTPWTYCRTMADDARPPPTPERCRPAVMLTGPPAIRRHPRARTT